MSAFDHMAAMRSCRDVSLVESGTGRTHFVVDPGPVTRIAVEGVARFRWKPRTMCGLTPRPRWSHLSHCGERICRTCLTRWHWLVWTFERLDTETHPADHARTKRRRK